MSLNTMFSFCTDFFPTSPYFSRVERGAKAASKVLFAEKAEKKNRTKQEVDRIICWLTGYDENGLTKQLQNDVDYKTFFEQAPDIHLNCEKIKGFVCGVRVEEIEDPIIRQIRYLDKLISER